MVKKKLIQNYNNQGITENYPQYTTNFWGSSPENNYGFGTSKIHNNIENMQNQTNFGNSNNTQWGMNNEQSQVYNPLGNSNSTFNSGLNNSSLLSTNNMQGLNLNASAALYPQQNSFSTYSQPYQLAQNSLPNSASDVGNITNIPEAQKHSLFGNNNRFNQNQSVWNKNQYQTQVPSRYNLKDLTDRLQQYQNNALDKQPRYDLNQLPDINALGYYANPNQTAIPDNKQMSMISTRPTLSQWLKRVNTQPMTMNGTNMNGKERIKALVKGQPIVINIEDTNIPEKSKAGEHNHNWGKAEVDKYGKLIEQYAKQYNLNPNIAKAILYIEASDYHKNGWDFLADRVNFSTSVRPMNIQGETWGNFQGQLYDVKNPEQNIELGVRVLKAIYDAVPNKNIAKIATLWNGTGLRNVNDYGKKAQEYYLNQSWNDPYEMPQLESE